MTDLVQWNNCAGCMGKRSLLSEQSSYIHWSDVVNNAARERKERKKKKLSIEYY